MRGLIDAVTNQAIPSENSGGHFAGLPVTSVRTLTGVAFPGRAGTLAAVSADIELTSLSATVPVRKAISVD